MNLQLSHLLFLVGLIIYGAIRFVFQIKAASNRKSVNKNSLSDRFLVLLVVVGQVGAPLLLLFSPWLNWANYTLPSAAIGVGALLLVAGLWLFWRSHTDLGNSWSVTLELNQNHRLVTQGVYYYIRHPMYASFFLLGLSQLLLLNNWFAGLAALVAVSSLYLIRTPHEEAMMIEHFGEQYRSYMQHTNGIIPHL